MSTSSPPSSFLCPITQSVMTDPVIGSDGITYERSAIMEWLSRGNRTSPVTRAHLSLILIPNYAIKSAIEEWSGGGQTSPPAVPAASLPPSLSEAPPPIAIDVRKCPGTTDKYHISLTAPSEPTATLPTLFIDVLDISGSMGEASVDVRTQAATDAAMFSRADLVKHSVATQIELLRDRDELAVILFDDRMETVLEPTLMNAAGKQVAKHCLPRIGGHGGTDIWRGLYGALQLAANPVNREKNIVIILQTDGESDPSRNPPRGIPATFRSWMDTRGPAGPKFTLHTIGYGFGDRLDMPLLRELAEIGGGGGTTSYIPDGSMVGTVFIHLMANLMSCLYSGLTLQIPEAAYTQSVGFLQGGQSKDYIVTLPEPLERFTVAVGDFVCELDAGAVPEATEADVAFHTLRQDLIARLREALRGEGGVEISDLVERATVATDPRMQALATDLSHPDKYKGQIGKALASPEAFKRWGRHYLPSVICCHQSQWPVNFKDAGCELYGGPYTRELIMRGDEIFNSLPPPVPTTAVGRGAAGWIPHTRLPQFTTRGVSAYDSALAPLASMMSVHTRDGGCFLGATRIQMHDGSLKRADQIQPGDYVAHGYYVRCVVKILHTNTDSLEVVPTHYGGITPWHPVYLDGRWQHPVACAAMPKVAFAVPDPLYNFVLTDGHTVIADGYTACTLAHTFTTDDVIRHPYYGAREGHHRNVMDDLEASKGWDVGFVIWRNPVPIREGGRVTRMMFGSR